MKRHLHLILANSWLLPSIALLLSVAMLYGQFLWNPIIFDDLPFFMVDDLGGQPVDSSTFSLLGLRSLPYATLAWTKAWFGTSLIYFRLGNLLLHAATVLAIYAFLKTLFTTLYVGKSTDSLTANQAAILVAFLFALHPISTYSVGYLVQRTMLMATLFSLLSMLAYAKGCVENKPLWMWACVPLYYLAVYAKEHAIMLVAVLGALTVLLHPDWRTKLQKRWLLFATLLCIALLVVLTRKELIGSAYEPDAKDMLDKDFGPLAYPYSVLTQCGLFFKYILLWIWPNIMWTSIDMREPFVRSFLAPQLAALALYLVWGGIALWLLAKRGNKALAGFSMLYPWVMFFTELVTVRIQEPFVLYRSYLWASAGLTVLPVLLAGFNRRILLLVFSAVGLTFGMLSMERMATFSNPILVWEDAKKLVDGKANVLGAERIYYNLGRHQFLSGMLDESQKNLQKAISIEPDYPQPHGVLGALHLKQEQWGAAISEYSAAQAISEKRNQAPRSLYLLGRARAYEGSGALNEAANDYLKACRIDERVCEMLKKSATSN
jgi:hypothetical protein